MAAPLPCLKTAVRKKTGRNLATSHSLARSGFPASRLSSSPHTRKFSAPTLPIMNRELSMAPVYLRRQCILNVTILYSPFSST